MGLYSVYPALICHHCKYITTCLLRSTHTYTHKWQREKNDINVHFHYVQIIEEGRDKICGKCDIYIHFSTANMENVKIRIHTNAKQKNAI